MVKVPAALAEIAKTPKGARLTMNLVIFESASESVVRGWVSACLSLIPMRAMPMAMLKNVAALAQSAGMPCEVSLERRMACGVGACMGCVTEVLVKKGDSESISHERVCNEGPVFDAGRIVWNDV